MAKLWLEGVEDVWLGQHVTCHFFSQSTDTSTDPAAKRSLFGTTWIKTGNLNTIRKKLSAEPTVVLEWLFFGPGRRQCSEQVHRRRSVSLKHPGSRGWNRGGKTRWGDADVVYQCFNNAGNYSLFLDKVCLLSDQRRIGRTPRTAGEKQALAASQQGSLLRFWNVMTCHSRWIPWVSLHCVSQRL